MTITFDTITILQFVVSSLLPLLVGLVTTKVTHSGLKAVLLASLTLVTSLIAEGIKAVQAGEVYDLGAALLLALPAFVTAVSLQWGLYRPTGATEIVQESGITPKVQ